MITTQDKELLAKKGITEAQIAEQLACFQTGFPYLKLDAAASIEKGILAPDAEEKNAYLAAWDAYKNTDKIIVKFVPASGAASRMFKNLFEFLSAEYDTLREPVKHCLPKLWPAKRMCLSSHWQVPTSWKCLWV